MAQGFMPSKRVTQFSDILYSHLERLSSISTAMLEEPTSEKIYAYHTGINHLKALLSPYIPAKSRFEEIEGKISIKIEDGIMYPDMVTFFQIEYIGLLQEKLSILVSIMYENNLLETKKDSYGDDEEEENEPPV